jgi:hypothetical protein
MLMERHRAPRDRFGHRVCCAASILVIGLIAGASLAQEWTMPKVERIELPKDVSYPWLACTPKELANLKAAYEGQGPAHDVVADVIAKAEAAMAKPLDFPPRGGQHNQWYQCEACQTALKTLDDTHHQCPTCKKIYTGFPYDDVIFSRKHSENLRNLEASAWAYAVTGKKPFAQFAAKVLLGYAERYKNYPFHSNDLKAGKSGAHIYEQTLGEAYAMAMEIGPAFDLVRASGVLSEKDVQAVREGLILPMLQTIDGHKAGKSNWQTWHNAAFVWGGAALGDANWIRGALEDPENGFAFQMKVSVTGDGMWYENSWGYHFYTLSALVATAEGCRHMGIDLWSHPGLKKMFTLPAAYAMADGSLPRFGDDVHTQANGQWSLNERAYRAYNAPAIAELLPGKPNWQSVMFGRQVGTATGLAARPSEIFRSAGHAILRTRGPAGLTAAFTFGPYGGFHGHLDKLSFVFFGEGRELGVDPGRAASQAYRLPIHGNWYKATISHNAVIVDGNSQAPAEGKLEFFEAKDDCVAVVASCDAAYPGVKHRRMLCMTGGYLLVLDDLQSERERRFDWVYHNRGSDVRCELASGVELASKEIVGLEYVKNLRSGKADGAIAVEFDGNDVKTFLTLAGAAGTLVRIGDGVGASVADRVPMAMVTRRGPAARFAAVIEPVRKGQAPAVTGVSVEQDSPGLRVTVLRGAARDVILLDAASKVTVRSGEKALIGAGS